MINKYIQIMLPKEQMNVTNMSGFVYNNNCYCSYIATYVAMIAT